MRHTMKALATTLMTTLLFTTPVRADNAITPTERGAIAETGRYRAEFRDGALVSFLNKLTGEAYLETAAPMDAIRPHLPSGLGTQHEPEERAAARKLYDSPWGEKAIDAEWPNQHWADGNSQFAYEASQVAGRESQVATLTYTGLTDGTRRFEDETFTLTLEICAETGDLLVTPAAATTRDGVYGVGFALAPLAPEVTVEAPIFEGVRLDRRMIPTLWVNFWGSFWDYSFVALNGENAGAVGLWCQDPELRIHKNLFYRVDGERLTLAVQAMNIPPFSRHTDSRPMTWRLQAFEQGWWQAVARFRDWREETIKFAPRPDWAREISGMITGTQGAGGVHIIPYVQEFFPGIPLHRILAWLPDVRRAGFDRNHADNTPYENFKEDLQLYEDVGMKTVTYLIPTIMWAADARDERERAGLQYSKEAMTTSPFQEDDEVVHNQFYDQNHLGHAGWQRWFLDWVREYIRDYGTDGIYHDQSYLIPIDNRGLINGMTTPQGFADYFYKAQAENPGSLHTTEHLTEVNITGASMGLGSGIHWGSPGYNVHDRIGPEGSMSWQRIKRASPIVNALHYPQGAIMAFPHMSGFNNGVVRFHHGMDQVERRGDFPGDNLYAHFGRLFNIWNKPGERFLIPFDQWANALWLDRERQYLFLKHGLRATFPETWERQVLTYFAGVEGADFRYEELSWGTAFVQIADGNRIVHYARIQESTRAPGAGTILGWPCYDAEGPAGLDPSIIYVVDGSLARPPAWFTLTDEATAIVHDGYADETMAWMELTPADDAEATGVTLSLTAPQAPVAVWVDGTRIEPEASDRQWRIPARTDSVVVALLAEPQAGFDALADNRPLTRHLDAATRRDLFKPAAFAQDMTHRDGTLTIGRERSHHTVNFPGRHPQYQTHIPVKAEADGVLRLGTAGLGNPVDQQAPAVMVWRFNGKEVAPGENGVELPMKAGEVGILSVAASAQVSCAVEWE